ncbi:MAG TPA: RHS repeat-associated core domain-containing protein [Terracidiphilus sp.]|nr:RHS repeat-associated core domain-containing protein [Terracidiphilus sp.]
MTASEICSPDESPSLRSVIDSYEYDAYGNEFTVSGSTPNEMMYRGEQYDSDLGLYYLRARYYNPFTGRFMSRDPESGNQFDPTTLHKYLYAGGDPVNLIDPTGRDELFETALVVGGSALGPAEVFLAATGEAFTTWLESGPVSYAAARIPDLIRWVYASESLRWVFKQVACLVIAGAAEATLSHVPENELRHWEAEKFALVTAIDRVCIEAVD